MCPLVASPSPTDAPSSVPNAFAFAPAETAAERAAQGRGFEKVALDQALETTLSISMDGRIDWFTIRSVHNTCSCFVGGIS